MIDVKNNLASDIEMLDTLIERNCFFGQLILRIYFIEEVNAKKFSNDSDLPYFPIMYPSGQVIFAVTAFISSFKKWEEFRNQIEANKTFGIMVELKGFSKDSLFYQVHFRNFYITSIMKNPNVITYPVWSDRHKKIIPISKSYTQKKFYPFQTISMIYVHENITMLESEFNNSSFEKNLSSLISNLNKKDIHPIPVVEKDYSFIV